MKPIVSMQELLIRLTLVCAIFFSVTSPLFATPERGGKLLNDGDITVELAIFERGVAPEYRAWITRDGKPLNAKNLALTVELTRLGGKIDRFAFSRTGDYWSGAGTVEEPHSFDVRVMLKRAEKVHEWAFASYEGRTEIAADIAAKTGIQSDVAGPGEINQTTTVYGRVVADPSRVSHIRARFPGTITRVSADIGDRVDAGATLAEVESSESLKRYSLTAPFAGVITTRHATPGELAEEQALFTVANFDRVWAEFQVFPGQVRRVAAGQKVSVSVETIETESVIKHLIPSDKGHPFVLARAPIDNTDGQWTPGLLLEGKVSVSQVQVPLVVDNRALQSFRNWKVAFIQVGDSYEVRPLKLGRSDGRFTEVLGGLNAGDRYVVENSYLIKADLEKSGAAHHH